MTSITESTQLLKQVKDVQFLNTFSTTLTEQIIAVFDNQLIIASSAGFACIDTVQLVKFTLDEYKVKDSSVVLDSLQQFINCRVDADVTCVGQEGSSLLALDSLGVLWKYQNIQSDQKTLVGKQIKLLSGSYYLNDNQQLMTGGDQVVADCVLQFTCGFNGLLAYLTNNDKKLYFQQQQYQLEFKEDIVALKVVSESQVLVVVRSSVSELHFYIVDYTTNSIIQLVDDLYFPHGSDSLVEPLIEILRTKSLGKFVFIAYKGSNDVTVLHCNDENWTALDQNEQFRMELPVSAESDDTSAIGFAVSVTQNVACVWVLTDSGQLMNWIVNFIGVDNVEYMDYTQQQASIPKTQPIKSKTGKTANIDQPEIVNGPTDYLKSFNYQAKQVTAQVKDLKFNAKTAFDQFGDMLLKLPDKVDLMKQQASQQLETINTLSLSAIEASVLVVQGDVQTCQDRIKELRVLCQSLETQTTAQTQLTRELSPEKEEQLYTLQTQLDQLAERVSQVQDFNAFVSGDFVASDHQPGPQSKLLTTVQNISCISLCKSAMLDKLLQDADTIMMRMSLNESDLQLSAATTDIKGAQPPQPLNKQNLAALKSHIPCVNKTVTRKIVRVVNQPILHVGSSPSLRKIAELDSSNIVTADQKYSFNDDDSNARNNQDAAFRQPLVDQTPTPKVLQTWGLGKKKEPLSVGGPPVPRKSSASSSASEQQPVFDFGFGTSTKGSDTKAAITSSTLIESASQRASDQSPLSFNTSSTTGFGFGKKGTIQSDGQDVQFTDSQVSQKQFASTVFTKGVGSVQKTPEKQTQVTLSKTHNLLANDIPAESDEQRDVPQLEEDPERQVQEPTQLADSIAENFEKVSDSKDSVFEVEIGQQQRKPSANDEPTEEEPVRSDSVEMLSTNDDMDEGSLGGLNQMGLGSEATQPSMKQNPMFQVSQTVSSTQNTGFGLSQFGTPIKQSGFGQSGFVQDSATGFSKIDQNAPSAFGTPSAFGSPQTFATPMQQPATTNAFSTTATQPATFGQSTFGQSGFGAASTPQFGSTSFGAPAFGQSAFGGNAFGSKSPQQSVFGQSTTSTVFGTPGPSSVAFKAPQGGGFGSLAQSSQQTNVFGSAQNKEKSNLQSFSQFQHRG